MMLGIKWLIRGLLFKLGIHIGSTSGGSRFEIKPTLHIHREPSLLCKISTSGILIWFPFGTISVSCSVIACWSGRGRNACWWWVRHDRWTGKVHILSARCKNQRLTWWCST
jgi:hypothetical protein